MALHHAFALAEPHFEDNLHAPLTQAAVADQTPQQAGCPRNPHAPQHQLGRLFHRCQRPCLAATAKPDSGGRKATQQTVHGQPLKGNREQAA
jgi:hypothetical protein